MAAERIGERVGLVESGGAAMMAIKLLASWGLAAVALGAIFGMYGIAGHIEDDFLGRNWVIIEMLYAPIALGVCRLCIATITHLWN